MHETRIAVTQVVVPDLDRLRIQVNQLATRTDFTESKLTTIEKHMPSIIEELLVFGLE